MDLISVRDVRELKATVLAFARLPATIRTEINRQTRAQANPIWQGEIAEHTRSKMDALVIAKGARVKAGNPPVLQAATSTRPIGGRLRPADEWAAFEFGANRGKRSTYDRRKKRGGRAKVTRHTAAQLPTRIRKGRVAYPSAAESIPRLASLWVQTVVRCVHEAAEGKSGG